MSTSSEYDKIFELDLSDESLKTLSRDVLKYTNLKKLNLSGNQLKEIPVFLKELKHLEVLDVSNNQLTALPDFFRSFPNLTELDISYNSLTILPFSLWKLTGLVRLDISGLQLNQLPVEVGNLKQLRILHINDAKLVSLPETIGYVKELEELSLKNNRISKLPRTFDANYIKNLKKLNLAKNNLQTFPKAVFNLKELEYLNVSNNEIKLIPKQISLLKKLSYLNIAYNKIKAIPVPLYSLNLKKTHFHFNNNLLSRVFQDEINEKFGFKDTLKKEKKKKKKSKKEKKKSKRKVHKPGENKNTNNIAFGCVMLFLTPFIIFGVFFYNNSYVEKTKEIIKENDDSEIASPNRTYNSKPKVKYDPKKHLRDYQIARENYERSFKHMHQKTKEVLVYTNDHRDLKLIMKPNAKFSNKNYFKGSNNEEKASYINKFLRVKYYGYSILIDNGTSEFKQIWLHDSILPSYISKKFRVTRVYRMTEEEKVLNRLRDRKRISYRKKPRNDKVFAVNQGVVDFLELNDKMFRVKTRKIFTPKEVDLSRRENYFYFTSLNNNVTKKEFLKAVENFNDMFITKGNPKRSCKVRTLKVKKE